MSEKTLDLVSIVNADVAVQKATADVLESNGFRAQRFASEEEFLASPAAADSKCVLLDARGPWKKRRRVRRWLKNLRRAIPVILIIAHGEPQVRAGATRAGAIDFLSDNFTEDALVSPVRAAVEGRT
jgi:two-component system response regulator FixJ